MDIALAEPSSQRSVYEAVRAVDPRALPTNDEDDGAQLYVVCYVLQVYRGR